MEYLSDIPHRQYDPLHTRRTMAPSHPTDMPVGTMAAVSPQHARTYSFPTPSWAPQDPPENVLPHHEGNFFRRRRTTNPNLYQLFDSVEETDHLTEEQNQYLRNSPPIQPGEKLPSFSEFVEGTRAANTPPRTPGRSANSSPRDKPQFEDVPWQEGVRQRNDTLGDIFVRPFPEASSSVHRRMSSAIDPALHSRGSPQPSSHGSMHQHHRQSLSYPPPHMTAPDRSHYRQPSPGSQGHAAYPHTPSRVAYPPPPSQHGVPYEHRPSYYSDRQSAPPYPYDRPHESYYGQPPYPISHPGYENSYHDIRFHQHVGIDQNAFNRKRRGNLPKEATNTLKEWFNKNRASPYPTEDQKLHLCHQTGLSLNQVSNWFINARRRAPQREAREREGNGPDA